MSTHRFGRIAARNVEQIRRAAISAFHGRGLDTPLEQIAASAGVSKGTIYHRFGGRSGLIDAVIGELVGVEMHKIINRALQTIDPWASVATYIADRRALHYREPAAVDSLIMAYPQSEQLALLAAAATEATDKLLQRAKNAHTLRNDFTTSDLFYADAGNGLAMRQFGRPSLPDYNRRTALFIESLRER
ncbi:TetR/AcrR family transcriptional regulator [Microbacterium elymi]|uniref:TetR/AcrR family transcriptional regulator n=1 Tax=Microbacterium elymi TaxID=2909587 RepID=A0ABY5NJW9_9MICO|nr:TetR/AcrR family transcriptional regulator [Microbacterium elymi]UUT35416.1 TetR/AcrR family transcriptional regulator [Microbacterium elymi]